MFDSEKVKAKGNFIYVSYHICIARIEVNKKNSPSHSLHWHALSPFLISLFTLKISMKECTFHVVLLVLSAQFPHSDAKVNPILDEIKF